MDLILQDTGALQQQVAQLEKELETARKHNEALAQEVRGLPASAAPSMSHCVLASFPSLPLAWSYSS